MGKDGYCKSYECRGRCYRPSLVHLRMIPHPSSAQPVQSPCPSRFQNDCFFSLTSTRRTLWTISAILPLTSADHKADTHVIRLSLEHPVELKALAGRSDTTAILPATDSLCIQCRWSPGPCHLAVHI